MGDYSIIELIINALSEVTQKIILVTNLPEQFSHLNLPMYGDDFPDSGPLGDIYTGLRLSETYYNLVVACNMPFIQPNFLYFLINQSKGYSIAIPLTPDGYHPLCAVYSKRCIKPIEMMIKTGNLKVSNLFSHVKVNTLDFDLIKHDFNPNIFFNINTYEDYLMALSVVENRYIESELVSSYAL